MTADERTARPAPIPLPVLADAVIELIRNDDCFGHVVVLRPDQQPPSLTRQHQEIDRSTQTHLMTARRLDGTTPDGRHRP